MTIIWKLLMFLLALAVALSTAALALNGVPLTSEPGLGKRLFVYFSRNEAATAVDHEFPELRPRIYPLAAQELFQHARQNAVALGWQIKSIDPAAMKLHAVVTTSLLNFKDDLSLEVEAVDKRSSRLKLRSASRVGRADFGANLGHLIRFDNALIPRVAQSSG